MLGLTNATALLAVNWIKISKFDQYDDNGLDNLYDTLREGGGYI